jgi:hypothetical protein
LLLALLRVLSSLDLGGVEVGVVLLVRAILLFLSLLVFVVFVVFLLLEGLAGEKEDGAGDDALTDVVTDLKVCGEQVLRNSKQFRLIRANEFESNFERNLCFSGCISKSV